MSVSMVLTAVTAIPPVQAASTDSGSLYAWGINRGVQGNGTRDDSDVPVKGGWGAIPIVDRMFTDIAISPYSSDVFACGLAGGKAYCWGDNSRGQLGSGSFDDSSLVPVAVDATGVLAGKTLVDITTGRQFACAIDTDGHAFCWGDNGSGQLGDGGGSSRVPVAVDRSGVLSGVRLTQISSGAAFTCALGESIYCWGSNASGQLGNGTSGGFAGAVRPTATTMSPFAGASIASVSVGWDTSCAVTTSGRAYCWGFNRNGQLGVGDYQDDSVPTAVSTSGILAGKVIEGISPSYRTTCAWADAAYCWGYGWEGQLGTGTEDETNVPVQVDSSGVLSGKDIDHVSVGQWSACALDSDGIAYCWGAYWDGVLGTGARVTNALTPVAVADGRTYARITVGGGSVLAITGPLAYSVTYDPNGADSGSAPITGLASPGSVFTVADNSGGLSRSGFVLGGWNTRADGQGTTYPAGSGTFTVTENITLYALWQALPPPPLVSSGPPLDVRGTPGNGTAQFSWEPPVSAGSFPITRYYVLLLPVARTCLVSVTSPTCRFDNLANGTAYTARVRALTGAGWGTWSQPSPPVTPMPPPPPPNPTISVTVDRRSDPEKPIKVRGATTHIGSGTALWVWVHERNEFGIISRYQGVARPVVGADGSFTWQRQIERDHSYEVLWCTQPQKRGTCSPWTVL